MTSVVNKLLQKNELPRRLQGGAAAPALVARNDDRSHAQPRVQPGSMLDLMLSLNSDRVPDYVAAVLGEIERCIGTCTIQVPDTSEESILDQIHALKNALAPSGAAQLLQACERLRSDVCHGVDRIVVARRYQAVANAALKLVKGFRETLAEARGS
ncbi:hypothetical protein [Xanthomonas graminis]|uniref:HPt domain-containing protein n=1 Tax=Xanthomonas graminis pv. arrhenatheri LMG 727 TaxID=1195923 RepID=A0A0K2ZEB8_9XANT|nr:hypothetical protein [Xanthomonas translucens]UKE78204.1 hypothetical protein KM317_02855 [Xanthomonas translucens pv. arrhenatheri]CTP83212.1 hypothetical protein XTALMG727_0554 [Xanthomonas translucens pv. arrhenatheri LMG 727]